MSSGGLTKSNTNGSSFAGNLPVQTRERLHRLHAVQSLVHIHRVKQRLIETCLILIRHQQHLIIGRSESLRQLLFADRLAGDAIRVHPRLRVFDSGFGILHGAAECNERPNIRVALPFKISIERQFVAHRMQAR